MNVETYEIGVPYWVALSATNRASAIKFYGALFGWNTGDSSLKGEAHEGVCLLRGLPVASIIEKSGTGQVAWLTHVNVADAEETARSVIRAGGSILAPPAGLGAAGRLAVCADPSGAAFGVWEPGERKGAGLVREPGAYAWSELITDDVGASLAFYRAVFSWTLTTPAAGDPSRRQEWQMRGRSIAGLLPRPPAMPKEIPPYWDVYFAVPDAGGAVESVKRLGGTNVMPPTDIAQGRIAVFVDPGGAVFSVITPKAGSGH